MASAQWEKRFGDKLSQFYKICNCSRLPSGHGKMSQRGLVRAGPMQGTMKGSTEKQEDVGAKGGDVRRGHERCGWRGASSKAKSLLLLSMVRHLPV